MGDCLEPLKWPYGGKRIEKCGPNANVSSVMVSWNCLRGEWERFNFRSRDTIGATRGYRETNMS